MGMGNYREGTRNGVGHMVAGRHRARVPDSILLHGHTVQTIFNIQYYMDIQYRYY